VDELAYNDIPRHLTTTTNEIKTILLESLGNFAPQVHESIQLSCSLLECLACIVALSASTSEVYASTSEVNASTDEANRSFFNCTIKKLLFWT
jgi:hypothetical protein